MDDRLHAHLRATVALRSAAGALLPRLDAVDRRFRRASRASFDPPRLRAILQITPGAAARLIAATGRTAGFLEQVEYNGRRLAKLNVPPNTVARALAAYHRLLGAGASGMAALRAPTMLALNHAYYRVHAAEAQAFFDLFRAELEAGSLDNLLARFGKILSRTFHARAARVFLGESGLARRFIMAGDPAETQVRETSWRGRYSSYWSVPFFVEARPAGLIQLAFARRYEWLPRELELLEAVGERCLAAAEKARLAGEVRELAAHIFDIEERERRRISRELHDEAGQSLLFTRLQLEMLERTAPASWPDRTALSETRAVIERTILEIRRILAALSPAVLEQLGLAAAVRQLTARFRQLCPAHVSLRLALRRHLPATLEAVAYRLVQECYQNIARHSGASRVKVSLRSTDHSFGLRVEDDGAGFDPQAVLAQPNSFGLAGMRERVTLMGGRFEIRSAPGRGTAIIITLPVRRAAPSSAVSIRKSEHG